MRDLARYAGRIVRSTARGNRAVVITDRGRALAMLVPVSGTVEGFEEPALWESAPRDSSPPEPPPDLSEEERRVLANFGDRPLGLSAALRASGLDRGPASVALARLEMKGLVRRTWGGSWERATPR